MPELGVLEVCSSISPPGQKRHRSFVEDGLVLAVIKREEEKKKRSFALVVHIVECEFKFGSSALQVLWKRE